MRLLTLLTIVVLSQLLVSSVHAELALTCGALLDLEKIRPELRRYEAIRILTLERTHAFENFSPSQGLFVTRRDSQGHPIEATIRVLSDNPGNMIEVVGDFNHWGANGTVRLHPDLDPHYVVGTLTNIRHGMQYRLRVNGRDLIDPAALVQTTPEFHEKMYGKPSPDLNSVFWDIEGVGKYVPKNKPVDLRAEPIAVSENDILFLAKEWPYQGKIGPEKRSDMYNFIADSGIIQQIKEWGYNAIEFLPLTTSVDGDFWAHRYLPYAPFSIDSRWGTPAEFARMIDVFNGADIAVVFDIIPGHYAYRGNQGIRDLDSIGKHNFKKPDGRALYGDTPTVWGTLRYDYENRYGKKYLVDGILNSVKYFNLSGIRIDNYDEILRLPGGRTFLNELNTALRNYSPAIFNNIESFGDDNSITLRIDWGGHGATTHYAGDFSGFIYEMAQKRTEEIDMYRLRGILRNLWDRQDQAVVLYHTDHDKAATYFASHVGGGGWNFVEGKTRVSAALAMLSGSFYLDIPHLRILQEGSFYHNTAVEWGNLQYESQRHISEFLAELTRYYTSHRAFAFHNTHPDIENHIDNDNKIISLKRIDFQTGQIIYAVVNLGDRALSNYRFGVSDMGHYSVVIDSDRTQYGGSNGLAGRTQDGLWADADGLHDKAHHLSVPYLAPFSVTVLEKN